MAAHGGNDMSHENPDDGMIDVYVWWNNGVKEAKDEGYPNMLLCRIVAPHVYHNADRVNLAEHPRYKEIETLARFAGQDGKYTSDVSNDFTIPEDWWDYSLEQFNK